MSLKKWEHGNRVYYIDYLSINDFISVPIFGNSIKMGTKQLFFHKISFFLCSHFFFVPIFKKKWEQKWEQNKC